MSLLTWTIWALASAAFNFMNAVNRRALQSRNWVWNAWSSFIVGILFASSIVGVGNEILRAGSKREIGLAILVYGIMCVLGSVLGQELVLRLPYFQQIEKSK